MPGGARPPGALAQVSSPLNATVRVALRPNESEVLLQLFAEHVPLAVSADSLE